LVSTAPQVQLLKSMMPFETSYDGSDPVEKFGGAQLVQQEPDASSFPNGGIRNTFEKRIYRMGSTSPCIIYGTTYVFLLFLFRIPEKHWIIKFRC
jgi:glutamine synthetase type III